MISATGNKQQATARSRAFLRTVACCLLLVAGGCKTETIGADWHRITPPAEAPDFVLQQLDGSTVKLSDLRGRVVVMEFWATWCGPCRYSLPSLDVIAKKYKDREVTVLLINQDETPEVVREWIGHRITAPILLDAGSHVARQYEVDSIPRLVVLDREGRMLYLHQGYGGGLERNLSLILDGLLGEPNHA